MSAGSIPCSVLILTRNSAESIERCVQNLAPFAEILVHDANSEDDTVAIARRYGARIEKQYDTDEKSVRVKDFTEMRLKQRAAARYDWVLYLDGDEYLSDALIEEIRLILLDADPKTIVKFPRLPVIEGRIRTAGIFYPEVMPRIHHRKSGATLRKGKVVHEKYVYDDTFTEVVTRNPLLFPLPEVSDLRRKDDRYITLEVQNIEREGMRWKRYLRWFLFREPLLMLSLIGRMMLFGPRYWKASSVPIAHDWRYVTYHWRLFRAVSGAMLAHPLRQGRI